MSVVQYFFRCAYEAPTTAEYRERADRWQSWSVTP